MNLPSLAEAYTATEYRVLHGDACIVLRIGEPAHDLDDLLPSGVRAWAFITPCNPRSQTLSDEENCRRLSAFRQDVDTKHALIEGVGVGTQGDWPPEPSFLVLNIERADALALATRWEQNAFVFGQRGGVAELVWCPLVCGSGGGSPR